MSLHAVSVRNRAGYILEAPRENYQDERVQKEQQRRAEKVREKALEDLTADYNIKRRALLRQAVHANPELVDLAAQRIQAYIVRQRLEAHPTAMEAYRKGGWSPPR